MTERTPGGDADEPSQPGPAEPSEPAVLPEPRDAVQRAHRVPRGFPDRHTYLRLDLGEEDTPASARVGEVIRSLPDAVLAHYPDPWPLRNKLSELHDVPPEWISITAGTDEAIRLVFDCFVEEGARVLLPRPSAGAYLAAALSVRGLEARATRAAFVLIKLTPPVSNWSAAFAAHKVLVGTRGHVGALSPYVRVTVTSEDDLETFLGVLDAVLVQGIASSPRVEGMLGDWDETNEGMA